MSIPDNVCAEHGQLKRSCTTCEAIRDANRVVELEAQVAALEARRLELEKAAEAVLWFPAHAWDLVDGRLFISAESVHKFDTAFRDLDELVHPEKRALRESEDAAIEQEGWQG